MPTGEVLALNCQQLFTTFPTTAKFEAAVANQQEVEHLAKVCSAQEFTAGVQSIEPQQTLSAAQTVALNQLIKAVCTALPGTKLCP